MVRNLAVKVLMTTTTNTNFFTDSRRQFSESQKKLAEVWEESQKQLSESQKKLVETWIDNLPTGMIQVNLSDTFQKTLNFQREFVNVALNTQQVAMQLAMETQKQFWDNYFQMTQKTAQETPSTTTASW
jgi:c-di-AMP phosphodiesterase-like protein